MFCAFKMFFFLQRTKKRLRGNILCGNIKGQVTVEYILLAVVLLAMFKLITGGLGGGNSPFAEFQNTPQNLFKSMVENGNWYYNEEESKKHHPNQHDTHYTPQSKP